MAMELDWMKILGFVLAAITAVGLFISHANYRPQ